MKNVRTLLFIFFSIFITQAQENIIINTNTTQMVLRVDANKHLNFEYYGKKIQDLNNLFDAKSNIHTDAFPAFGINPDKLIAIRATHGNGDMTLVFKYLSHENSVLDDNIEITTIHLKDEKYPFYVDLKYKVYKEEDIIEVWNEISHQEKKSVKLFNFASAYLPFNAPKAYVTHFHGHFLREFTQEETELNNGTFTIKSSEGIRNSTYDTASFLLSLDNKSTEDQGDVIAGSLAWTGNYEITFERDMNTQLHLTAGINNYASEYVLNKGKIFTTPALILTYSSQGKGKASRNLHRYARKYKIIDGDKPLKILFNSWEGLHMNFDENKIVKLIDYAAELGVELFVLDDGWFGNKYSRDDGSQGLGDWQTSKKKLPNGIERLIDVSENKDIKFGIWVEPEMVNTKSELYEKHPDWILQNTDRELIKGRGKTQVVLDLSNPKVQDFIFNMMNDLLNKHPRINYIKWDANANIANYGSTYLPKDRQSHLYIDYHLGLQDVFKRLREKHPHITMQACASGGGRANYGYLKYFNEFWPSDNMDALTRIHTQWGMSSIFPAITMASHVGKVPVHQTHRVMPIKFRFDVAMTGRLGFELLPNQMNEQEREFSILAIETYKKIRDIVQLGDLYRIISPYEHKTYSSLMYVDEKVENAVYFGFCERKILKSNLPLFKMKGLDPNASYNVSEINKDKKNHFNGNGKKSYSGDFLMNTGLNLDLQDEYDSLILQFSKIKD